MELRPSAGGFEVVLEFVWLDWAGVRTIMLFKCVDKESSYGSHR